ncbi:MAG: toll/interleukin-1 receptor domain-containing protein [Anaerolineae bacterium]|nr:toll/interleukin-1 receptor domain-containing protein [Anaerolineae bacterium]
MGSKVFISYSRSNLSFVKTLDAQLIEQGIEAWVDWRDIPPGVNWRQTLYDGLTASDVVLIFLSPAYIESENCRIECYLARYYGKRVIPIMVQDCRDMLPIYEETKGLEDVVFVNYAQYQLFGFPVDDDFLLNLIVEVVEDEPRAWYTSDALHYISYSSPDALFAGRVAADLTKANIDVFFTPLSSPTAIPWRESMARAMMRAKALIVCISPTAAQSSWVRREVLFAYTRHLPIYPIVTEVTASSQQLMQDMNAALAQSYEMRLLADVNWLYPNPTYEHLRDNLIAVLTSPTGDTE